MSTLPQRPRFWLHRSRRFWGGFGVMLIVSALWVSSLCVQRVLTYTRSGGGGFGASWREQSVSLILADGGFRVRSHEAGNSSVPFSGGEWNWWGFGAAHWLEWLPSYTHHEQSRIYSNSETTLFLPLWPVPLLWVILWPLWMARADKKEEERFRTLLEPRQAEVDDD